MNTKTHPKLIGALISGNGHFSAFSELIFQEARDGDDYTLVSYKTTTPVA